MAEIIHFRPKINPEEKALRNRLDINPDDFEALYRLLILKIREGRFTSRSDYAHKINHFIKTKNITEINRFLLNITPILRDLDWSELPDYKYNQLIKSLIDRFGEDETKDASEDNFNYWIEALSGNERFQEAIEEISATYFEDSDFLNRVHNLIPEQEIEFQSILGKTDREDKELKKYSLNVLDNIVEAHGLIEGIAFINIFGPSPLGIDRYPKAHLKKTLDKKHISELKKDSGYNISLTFIEKFLTQELTNSKIDFSNLYKLFILRYLLKKPLDDVCNALIMAIPTATLGEIEGLFLLDFRPNVETTWVYISSLIYTGKIEIIYKRFSDGLEADFVKDLFLNIQRNQKYTAYTALQACNLFGFDIECPLEFLVVGLSYAMRNMRQAVLGENVIRGYFSAGRLYYLKGLYEESMICYKYALFNTLFPMESDNILNFIHMEFFVETTRKLDSYVDGINFIAKFKIISEHGYPLSQMILNELEIAKRELEYEYASKKVHKIDEFYEMVAKEDFTNALTQMTDYANQSKIILTREQLQIILNKIQEKTEIIRGIKSIGAKCDMIMHMNRQSYEKMSSIIEIINENSSEIKETINLISQNTEKILDVIHKKNEEEWHNVNVQHWQGFYESVLGISLWKILHTDTQKYLLLAQHLYDSNRLSLMDEFGFVAIEYSKAIENEFRTKIIDNCLAETGIIKYKSDTVKTITKESKTTMGEICTLIDKMRKIKDTNSELLSLFSFVRNATVGKENIFVFKNNLFKIKDRYRNPAAHPSKYPKGLLEEFRNLLFEEGFLKSFMEGIQLEI